MTLFCSKDIDPKGTGVLRVAYVTFTRQLNLSCVKRDRWPVTLTCALCPVSTHRCEMHSRCFTDKHFVLSYYTTLIFIQTIFLPLALESGESC